MKKGLQSLFLLVALSVVFVSCSSSGTDTERDDSYQINNNEESLSNRYTEKDDSIAVDTTAAENTLSKAAKVKFDLKLVSEVSSPEINGTTVQATMISRDANNTRSLISYNLKGAGYLGAVDVAQISGNGKNINIRSNITFFDADINAVHADVDKIYAAVATSNPDIATDISSSGIRSYDFLSFELDDQSTASVSLPSYAANSIVLFGDRVYATSGNTGGLSVYNKELNERIAFVEIEDARWVDVNSTYIAVLKGDTDGDDKGSVVLINRSDYSISAEYPVDGVYTPEAKNTIELINHLAIIAAGKEGVKVMDLTTGTIKSSIPLPDPSALGLSPDVVSSNAASADDDKIFISNGEAGVFVAESNKDLSEYNPGEDISTVLLGKLQFGDLESVNHVSYRNKLLIVAAGLGGLKIVALTDK